jgi:hypothetical protein
MAQSHTLVDQTSCCLGITSFAAAQETGLVLGATCLQGKGEAAASVLKEGPSRTSNTALALE